MFGELNETNNFFAKTLLEQRDYGLLSLHERFGSLPLTQCFGSKQIKQPVHKVGVKFIYYIYLLHLIK